MAGTNPRTRGSLKIRADRIDFTGRVYLPVQQFVQVEWVGSVLLFVAAVAALIWANSPWAEGYHHLWDTYLTLDLGVLHVEETLHHWINDGLMAVFFFVVGLEIKRELLHGNLSDPRQASLPALAALGGMVVPALVYFALNRSGPEAAGWGIPMATDIAFALGVLGLLGRRLPSQLRVFLLALAIVDDLGAILVIAVFYTSGISLEALAYGAGLIGVLLVMRWAGVRSVMAYAFVGFFFWVAILESGIHATIAGVILGALTPSRPYVDPDEYEELAPGLVERYQEARDRGDHHEAEAVLGMLEELSAGTEAPLERMERKFHPFSAYVVLPVFALANSGVELSGEAIAAAMASSVSLGIAGGLIVGKLVGVLLASWLAVVTGLAVLPPGVRWVHVAGTGLLAGIGFTVALFITQLAFTDPVLVDQGKIGILGASILAGVVGYLFLRLSPATGESA
ncbi:MAG: Na+/H+ antiporter NhaA [Gemmatimonadota bacterium]